MLRNLGGIALGIGVAAALLVFSRWVVRGVLSVAGSFRRALAEGTVVLVTAAFVGVGLLFCGALTRSAVVACAAALGLVGLRQLGGPAAAAASLRADARMLRRVRGLVLASRPTRRAAVLVAVLVLPVLARALVAPPLGWDWQTYHGVKAALWAKNGTWSDLEAPGVWAVYNDRPAAASLLAAVGIAVVGTDLGATVPQAFFWLMCLLAFFVAARALGAREPWSVLAAVVFAAVAPVRLMVGSGYVEPLLLALLITGLAFARDARPRRPSSSLGGIVVAAAALGLAIAVKPNVLVISGALVAVTVGVAVSRAGRRASGPALAALALFLAGFAPWLARTWVRTGHPLSPLPVKIGPIVLGEANPEMAWYVDRPDVHPMSAASEAETLSKVFTSPLSKDHALGALFLIPLAVGAFRVRRTLAVWPGALVLLMGALALQTYYSAAFAVIRQRWAWSSSRFLLPFAAAGLLASVAGRRRAPMQRAPYALALLALALYDLVRYATFGVGDFELGLDAGACALMAVLLWAAVARRSAAGRLGAAAAAVAALLVVGAMRDRWRWTVLGSSYQIHPYPKYWIHAAESLDRADPMTIAFTSGHHQDVDNWPCYYFLGTRMQNRPVYVTPTRDGGMVPWQPGSQLELARRVDWRAWLMRLKSEGVEALMSFGPLSLEQRFADARPDIFHRLDGARPRWGLYLFAGAARDR